MKSWFLVLLSSAVLVLAGITACGVQADDLKAFAATQEASNQQIAAAIGALGKNVITPDEAKLVVNNAIATNQKALDAQLNKMQKNILSWWEVICTAAAIALPSVAAGIKLLDFKRNKTSEERVTAVLEKHLNDDKVAEILEKILKEKGKA